MTASFNPTQEKMPVLFVGHGSPMNAIEENEFSQAWAQVGQSLPPTKAILCISAHWETAGVQATMTLDEVAVRFEEAGVASACDALAPHDVTQSVATMRRRWP